MDRADSKSSSTPPPRCHGRGGPSLLLFLLLLCAIVPVVLLSGAMLVWLPSNTTSSVVLTISWNHADERTHRNSTFSTATLDPPIELLLVDVERIETILILNKDDREQEVVVFNKISSSGSRLDKKTNNNNNRQQQVLVWEGQGGEDDYTRMATLIFFTDSNAVEGAFSTPEHTLSLKTLSDGSFQLRRTPWNGFPESANKNWTDAEDLLDDEWPESGGGEYDDVSSSSLSLQLAHRTRVVPPFSLQQQHTRRRRHLQDNDIHTVDLQVIVTRRAVCEYDDEDADCEVTEDTQEPMKRRLLLSVAQTNRAFESGDVNARIRLVEVVFLRGDFDGRTTVSTLNVMLFSEDVAEFRDDVGADLVMFVTGAHRQNCGIALLDSHVSAVSYDCFDAYTFSHEIGHNFGANHDRLSTPEFQLHPYGHGFEYDGEFHTIMSYGCPDGPCPLMPVFSADDQELPDGRPIGDRRHDNVRIMNENAAGLSRLRATVVDEVDGDDPPPPTTANLETVVDQVLDCPESDRCGDEKSSYRKGNGDDCKEVCVCREGCTVSQVALWLSYSFAGYSCGEC